MKIYIGKSKLHGKGILAGRDIKKGEILFIIKGLKLNFLINNKEKAKIAGLNWIGFGKNIWVDPINYGFYINHSCNPNSAIKGRVTIVAIRNIKKDEEITFDYSLSEADIFWHIKCSCSSKNCRKTIKSIQFLPYKIFNKNISFVPKYFKQVFKNFNISNFENNDDFKDKWINFIKKDFSV
ncbi:MAG: SET domain-containing methyltransferase [Candidatus Paceibacterota bacterium]